MSATSSSKANKSHRTGEAGPGKLPKDPLSARRPATGARPSGKGRRTAEPSERPAPRATKQDRMLTLLSRPEGATLGELMQATDWQIHSVRGFLSGTVKKKLGLTLATSTTEGELRRYRVTPRFER